jgi:predicted nucleic acid-binding protein
VIAFDTNVLVYAIDRDEGQRHALAAAMVDGAIRREEALIPLQTLAEFVFATTRKRKLDLAQAREFVAGWLAVAPVVPYGGADLIAAIDAHKLSFFDALLWATAERAGVLYLVTEDQQDGRRLGRVTFLQPFAARNRAVLGLD